MTYVYTKCTFLVTEIKFTTNDDEVAGYLRFDNNGSKTAGTVNILPKDIIAALERVNARWKEDICTMTLTIKSYNKEAPLTKKEKKRITDFCNIRMIPYDVKFIDGVDTL